MLSGPTKVYTEKLCSGHHSTTDMSSSAPPELWWRSSSPNLAARPLHLPLSRSVPYWLRHRLTSTLAKGNFVSKSKLRIVCIFKLCNYVHAIFPRFYCEIIQFMMIVHSQGGLLSWRTTCSCDERKREDYNDSDYSDGVIIAHKGNKRNIVGQSRAIKQLQQTSLKGIWTCV